MELLEHRTELPLELGRDADEDGALHPVDAVGERLHLLLLVLEILRDLALELLELELPTAGKLDALEERAEPGEERDREQHERDRVDANVRPDQVDDDEDERAQGQEGTQRPHPPSGSFLVDRHGVCLVPSHARSPRCVREHDGHRDGSALRALLRRLER